MVPNLLQQPMQAFNFVDTSATRKIFSLKKRIRAVAGGTSASKTISILVWIIDYCQTKSNRDKLVTVVSESYPHLEKGAMLDFENIMKDRGYWNKSRWNQTKHVYTFETGNKLEFYSVDFGKAHGPRRDVLFVNECNNLDFKVVDQLITRTREIVWLDWNPSEEFWFYTDMLVNRKDDLDFITLTYLDNEALDEITIREIEAHKSNKNWWTVYGLGKIGVVEGRIYKNWQIIDEIPHEARLERRGLDFGYSNDPSALIDIYKYNDSFILDEIAYQKGLSNKQIADIINNLDSKALVIADSAEPKSIDELKSYGISVLPAKKGADSVRQGIQYVQDQKISVTKRSLNLIKEYRNYFWIIDKNDVITQEPEDMWNHALDAVRYALGTLRIPYSGKKKDNFIRKKRNLNKSFRMA